MQVIGRDAELTVMESFLDCLQGGPAAAVLEGEAGMGKTTLWAAGIAGAEARGLRVLQAEPAESETALSFSGIRDLLDPVLEQALTPLPAAQARALSRALVLDEDDGPAPDPHAIGVALLSALRALAETRPLLIAVDDVQWLDLASAGALGFAARRLRTEQVGVLLSRRARLESPFVEELRRSLRARGLYEIEVGPLDARAIEQVVQAHLGVALPRPLLGEVHDASGGNPFYALEIVRTLRRRGIAVEAGHPLPVPESLHDLVHGRLRALPAESRDYLLAAAALSHPTLSLVEAAAEVGREAGLAPALDAGIVELDGDRIKFTHPLLAAGVYERADPLRRMEVHARLADLADDPEARGRHLAASATDPDEEVAAALEEASTQARARGAPRAAALLLDRARELTPATLADEACRRGIEAAFLHFESGDSRRAESQLADMLAALSPGRNRARALVRLARVRSYGAQAEAADLFLRAIDEAEGDAEILAGAHEGVAACLFRLRERLNEAVEHAELATGLALELGDEALAAEALATRLLPETLLGRETAAATVDRALALQEAANELRVLAQPLFNAAVHWWWTDALGQARDAFLEMVRRSRELGDESSLPYVLVLLGLVECAQGDLGSAALRAREGQEAAEQSGQHTVLAYNLALEARVEAQRGRTDRARTAALRALELAPGTGGRPAEVLADGALGHLELSRGDSTAAVARLGPIVAHARAEAMAEPAAIGFVVDQIEALIELGRHEEARELLDWYEGHARRLERASALAASARCRGLLAAARGDVAEAIGWFESALAEHERVLLPLDRARTLLALGVAQRRAKQRRAARTTLERARDEFGAIGSALWADRASAELQRISGRAPAPGALTPAEERVAALVLEGKTNREIGAALFLSERTVEGHLSRIFGKLGVRSRTELARVLAARGEQGVTPPNTGDSPVSAEPVAP